MILLMKSLVRVYTTVQLRLLMLDHFTTAPSKIPLRGRLRCFSGDLITGCQSSRERKTGLVDYFCFVKRLDKAEEWLTEIYSTDIRGV